MSIQLDANIEFKVSSNRTSVIKTDNLKDNESQDPDPNINNNKDDISSSLYEQFEKMTLLENRICEKNFPQKVFFFYLENKEMFSFRKRLVNFLFLLLKATHFSQLPLEVIMLILKWVVSSHLDMRSLDAFSAVIFDSFELNFRIF